MQQLWAWGQKETELANREAHEFSKQHTLGPILCSLRNSNPFLKSNKEPANCNAKLLCLPSSFSTWTWLHFVAASHRVFDFCDGNLATLSSTISIVVRNGIATLTGHSLPLICGASMTWRQFGTKHPWNPRGACETTGDCDQPRGGRVLRWIKSLSVLFHESILLCMFHRADRDSWPPLSLQLVTCAPVAQCQKTGCWCGVRFCLVKGSSILMQHLTTWGKLMNTFLIWSRDPEHAECSFHYISTI